MPRICETRAGKARASRNSLVGCFRDPHNLCISHSQPVPHLIACHLGSDWLSGWGVTVAADRSGSQ